MPSPALSKYKVNFCDVRDVADAHVKALTNPNAAGHRHLVMSASLWHKDIALLVKKEFQPQGYFVPTMVVPNFCVRVNSLVDGTIKLILTSLSRDYAFDNRRVQSVLKVKITDVNKTIIDTANSLIQFKIIKRKLLKKTKVNVVQ